MLSVWQVGALGSIPAAVHQYARYQSLNALIETSLLRQALVLIENSRTSPVSCVISLTFSGDGENYTFLETSGYTESENP